jgi:hypothetical protein
MRSLLLYTVVQYVIAFLYVIIKGVDSFNDDAQVKITVFSSQKTWVSPNKDQLLDVVGQK